MQIKQITIIGVGLIGGSFGKALKARQYNAKIVGYGTNIAKLNKAVELNVIDEFFTDMQQAVKNADLIMVAVPMGAFLEVFKQLKPFIKTNTIITDAGSSKISVINTVADIFGKDFTNFVPSHPIAGKENSGVEAAEANLYEQHKVILTPTEFTNIKAIEQVKQIWLLLGAKVIQMPAQEHDQVLAATSHLPHLLAFSVVDLLSDNKNISNIFDFTAGGFKDFTRIASSDPTMWRDISLNNSDAIIKWLKDYQITLEKIINMIENNDSDQLFQLFNNAKNTRDKYVLGKKNVK